MNPVHTVSRFLLIYDSPMIPPVNLCANMPLAELANQGVIEYKAVLTYSIRKSDVVWADVVVIGRLYYPEEYDLCAKIMASGRYILYVLDDDLLNIPSNIRSYRIVSQDDVRTSIASFISSADGLISPSPVLLEKYGKGKKNILVDEPALDFSEPTKPGDVINIGFAGSADRTSDVEYLLETVIKRLKEHYGDKIQFYFMGATPDFCRDVGGVGIGYIDDYESYRQKIKSLKLDIGLAPMPASDFHSCKHYNKYIEYSSLGIAGVYSNVQPYSRLAEIDAPVVLVDNNDEEWYSKISALIDNPELLYDLKLKCNSFSKETFNIRRIAEDIKKKNHEVFKYKVSEPGREMTVPDFSSKRVIFLRLKRVFKKHGVKFPVVVAKKIWTVLQQKI